MRAWIMFQTIKPQGFGRHHKWTEIVLLSLKLEETNQQQRSTTHAIFKWKWAQYVDEMEILKVYQKWNTLVLSTAKHPIIFQLVSKSLVLLVTSSCEFQNFTSKLLAFVQNRATAVPDQVILVCCMFDFAPKGYHYNTNVRSRHFCSFFHMWSIRGIISLHKPPLLRSGFPRGRMAVHFFNTVLKTCPKPWKLLRVHF